MKTCICGEPLTTNEQLRRGYCTDICQRLHQPKFRPPRNGGAPVTAWSARPGVVRRPGTDNRKASNE